MAAPEAKVFRGLTREFRRIGRRFVAAVTGSARLPD
jgi:hypothetical protein